ncbi:DUF4062 domain-containing protein [Paraburkholderia sp. BR10882]|uniref:DUF4062 domain-containing protein n=1 Tax=unclassified Paraburkholderia TaxID=2615204 RepID=UPI0034CE4EBF
MDVVTRGCRKVTLTEQIIKKNMTIEKTSVFIASRFAEFDELRERLTLKIASHPTAEFSPVDLNNGHVSHRPPLVECLAHVRRSEFMILLIGDEYGSIAPGSTKSFTHLEYEEAVRDESGVRVLVFCIGEHYRDNQFRFAEPGTPLGDWQRDIEKRHTVGFFESSASVERIAQGILESLLIALLELRFGQLHLEASDQHRDLFDAVADDSVLDDSDVTAMESREFELRGLSMIDDRSTFSEPLHALMRPAAVAAYEQREEAQRAVALADYGCAIGHLQRAIEHRPLDLLSNYWLASLYVSLGRKQDCIRARELSERGARIALDEGSRIRASACYILAARAARVLGQNDEAVLYARRAVEVAPRYAKAHIEFARCLLLTGAGDDAMKSIGAAADLYFPSLREVFVDPQLRPLRSATNDLIEEMRVSLVGRANRILAVEARLAPLAGQVPAKPLDDSASRRAALATARQSASVQHGWVCGLMEGAQGALAKASSTPGSAAHTLRQELARLGELGRNDAPLLEGQESVSAGLSGLKAKARAYVAGLVAVLALGAAINWWLSGQRAGAVLGALVGMYLLREGYLANNARRQRLATAQAHVNEIRNRLHIYGTKSTSAKVELDLLEVEARNAVTRAKEALAIFETGSLRHPIGMLPFSSLFSGKTGELVRVLKKQIDSVAEKSGRTAVIEDEFPDWLDMPQHLDDTKPRLYRVKRSEGARLVLSRGAAYSALKYWASS